MISMEIILIMMMMVMMMMTMVMLMTMMMMTTMTMMMTAITMMMMMMIQAGGKWPSLWSKPNHPSIQFKIPNINWIKIPNYRLTNENPNRWQLQKPQSTKKTRMLIWAASCQCGQCACGERCQDGWRRWARSKGNFSEIGHGDGDAGHWPRIEGSCCLSSLKNQTSAAIVTFVRPHTHVKKKNTVEKRLMGMPVIGQGLREI